MSPGLKRGALAAGAIAVIMLLIGGVAAGVSEQHRIDRAHRAEVAQRGILRTTGAATTAQNQALEAAYVAATKLAQDVAIGISAVTATGNDLATATGALTVARSALNAGTSRRDLVARCLAGVKHALDATSLRDTTSATAFLRAAAPACESALTPPGEAGPALAYDFPDPFVLRAGTAYFAYATNAAGGAVQQARSADLSHWELAGDALTSIPAWAVPGATWSPGALPRPTETLLYYTVLERTPGRRCISVASSATPGGPFTDRTTAPMECGSTGAIDPSPFVTEGGDAYLLYKTEGPPRIWVRRLAPDGRSFTGPARLMLAPSQPWEDGIVEAPSMLRQGSRYWLFYSGSYWNGRSYAEGVARCSSPTGPCRAIAANPVLASHGRAISPGGGEVFTDASGAWWLAYHAYQEPLVTYPNSRLLRISRIGFTSDGTPTVTP